ncbi:hypothetical protein EOD39_1375 [Acipenser ruthenus]|uniref:Uncharacterized protein n=1 Tax=Acipenser ruthenus TaxID=7906 RepID=A0A444UCW6_ACIRT|nr:hypothetical protein EOD39_1375 [Acipenser ruthenus]
MGHDRLTSSSSFALLRRGRGDTALEDRYNRRDPDSFSFTTNAGLEAPKKNGTIGEEPHLPGERGCQRGRKSNRTLAGQRGASPACNKLATREQEQIDRDCNKDIKVQVLFC